MPAAADNTLLIILLAVLIAMSALSLLVLLLIWSGISRLQSHFEQQGFRSPDLSERMSMPDAPQPSDIPHDIEEALRAGSKIEAVKLYKEATGASLLDAKNAVEEMQRRMGLN